MRKVQDIMGMPITVDIPGCDSTRVFDEVFERFLEIDKRFSPYKTQSELSRYQRGEISKKDLSVEFRQVMYACAAAEKETDGYFSAYFSSKYDPTGYVKGWAIAEAAKVIEKKSYKTYCINAGGDILAASDSEKVWNIGIQNPDSKNEILNKLSISNGAVATSAGYERGKHIIDPKTKKPANKLRSVTVTGPDITRADVFSTAVFASENPDLIKKYPGYNAIVI
jgi:thiamine biosynthesis lipoprotein